MKGDRVEIVVDAGDTTRTYEVVASRAGRRVETAVRRGVVEVSEVTRNGSVVRTARFMATVSWRWSSSRCPGRTARNSRDDTGHPSGKTLRPGTPSPPRGVRRRSRLILREARQSVRGHDARYPSRCLDVEVKRRVQHSSPEVRHPPLPTTESGEGPWRTRHRGRRSARRDAGRTSPRSAPAPSGHAPPAGGDGHGPPPGGPARGRLRRLGRSGHTGVVRGRDAGALSGAPGPEERSGPGTSGHTTPWGRGCGGRQRMPGQLGSCAGHRAVRTVAAACGRRPRGVRRPRAVRPRRRRSPRVRAGRLAARTGAVGGDRPRPATSRADLAPQGARDDRPLPTLAAAPAVPLPRTAPERPACSPTGPTAPSSGTAGTVAKAHAPDTDPRRPRRPPRRRRPPALAGILLPPLHAPTRRRRCDGRPVTFWPYGAPVDPDGPGRRPLGGGRRPARPPATAPGRSRPRLPPMRGPAKAARAVARLRAARPGDPAAGARPGAPGRRCPAWARAEAPDARPPRPASSATATSTSASSSATPPPTAPGCSSTSTTSASATPPGTWPGPPPGTPPGCCRPTSGSRFLAAYRAAGGPAVPADGDPWPAPGRPRPRPHRADRRPRRSPRRRRTDRPLDEVEQAVIDACARMAFPPARVGARTRDVG